MGYRIVVPFLIASLCSAQTPTAVLPAGPPATAPETITVAQGTTVALALVSSIKSKSTRPGDSVRAVVAFPVTVGTRVAIPAGTYVEGIANAIAAPAGRNHTPNVRIHFTRLLFANGYAASLDAINTEAMVIPFETTQGSTYEIADARAGAPLVGEGFGAGGGQTTPVLPPLPPLPSMGPSPGVVAGAVLGGGAILVLGLVLTHRHTNADYVLFDNGWQFQMVLQHPLTLDASQVAAAANTPAR